MEVLYRCGATNTRQTWPHVRISASMGLLSPVSNLTVDQSRPKIILYVGYLLRSDPKIALWCMI